MAGGGEVMGARLAKTPEGADSARPTGLTAVNDCGRQGGALWSPLTRPLITYEQYSTTPYSCQVFYPFFSIFIICQLPTNSFLC